MVLPSLVTLRPTDHVDGNKLCYNGAFCYLTRYYFINGASIDSLKIATNELDQRLISVPRYLPSCSQQDEREARHVQNDVTALQNESNKLSLN